MKKYYYPFAALLAVVVCANMRPAMNCAIIAIGFFLTVFAVCYKLDKEGK